MGIISIHGGKLKAIVKVGDVVIAEHTHSQSFADLGSATTNLKFVVVFRDYDGNDGCSSGWRIRMQIGHDGDHSECSSSVSSTDVSTYLPDSLASKPVMIWACGDQSCASNGASNLVLKKLRYKIWR